LITSRYYLTTVNGGNQEEHSGHLNVEQTEELSVLIPIQYQVLHRLKLS
jgi:hypothetical protein